MREADAYPRALPGIRRAQDARQGDQHPAGTLRGRRHDGQLDELVPHARRPRWPTGSATLGLAGFARRRRWRRGSRGWKRGFDRAVGRRAQRQQRGARARRREARHLAAARSAATSRAAGISAIAGMGCPTNAKQSMLVTTIPARARRAARRSSRARARSAHVSHGERVDGARMRWRWTRAASRRRRAGSRVRARAFVAAAGAIGTPALLLRSGVPDPHGIVGKRTFLHPTVVSAALMPERVDGFAGAPQTDLFRSLPRHAAARRPDRLQARGAAVHPCSTAITLPDHGDAHAQWMRELPHLQVVIALLRDGFHADSPGGTRAPARRRHAGARLSADAVPVGRRAARIRRDGGDPVRRRRARAYAGARRRRRVHERRGTRAPRSTTFDLRPLATPVVSRARDGRLRRSAPIRAARSSTRPAGITISPTCTCCDGSLFPTSIGANPQLSIYGIVAKLATGLGRQRSLVPTNRAERIRERTTLAISVIALDGLR